MNKLSTAGLVPKLPWIRAVLLICMIAAAPCSAVHAQDADEEQVEDMNAPDDMPVTDTPAVADDAPAPEPTAESAPGESAPSDETIAVDEAAESQADDPWKLFFPPPDSRFDWIQLTSGEWLKGELRGLYNYKLEFESDELDVLTLDWEDIAIIRSAGLQAVGYEDTSVGRAPLTAYGQLTLIGDTATVGSGPDATTLSRAQIITIAKGTQKEIDLWTGEVAIGANAQRGNSDLTDASVYMKARRRASTTRFFADYRGQFSRTDEEETSNNHRINSYFDWFRTSRLYWRVVYAEYFRDRFQNIQNQLTLGTGLGYDIIRTPKIEWDVSAGVGALYKEAVSVEANEDAANTSPALTLGTNYDIELTSQVDYLFNYRVQITDEENGKYISHMVNKLSTDITGNLDLDVTLIWDYTDKPRPAEDGTTPKQDDYGLTIAISYEF